MKTIQISDGLWKRLRVEAAVRGVTMREVVEGMGAAWKSRSGPESPYAGTPAAIDGLRQQLGSAVLAPSVVRELKVELEE